MHGSDRGWWKAVAWFALAIVLVGALETIDWSKRRIVAEIAEAVVASTLYTGFMVAGVACGYLIGSRTARATRSLAAGWVVGVVAGFGIAFGVSWLSMQIPGVGWRVEEMLLSK